MPKYYFYGIYSHIYTEIEHINESCFVVVRIKDNLFQIFPPIFWHIYIRFFQAEISELDMPEGLRYFINNVECVMSQIIMLLFPPVTSAFIAVCLRQALQKYIKSTITTKQRCNGIVAEMFF
jgi:hypothetical protein